MHIAGDAEPAQPMVLAAPCEDDAAFLQSSTKPCRSRTTWSAASTTTIVCGERRAATAAATATAAAESRRVGSSTMLAEAPIVLSLIGDE